MIKHCFYRSLCLALFILTGWLTASAFPVQKGMRKQLTLSDGSTVWAELQGDENLHYWKSDDGRCFLSKGSGYSQVNIAPLQMKVNQNKAFRLQQNLKTSTQRRAAKRSNDLYQGTRKGLVILVDFPDKQFSTGHNLELYTQMINGVNYTNSLGVIGSVRDYFSSQSRGAFDLQFDVVGVYRMTNSYSYYGSDSDGQDAYAYRMIQEACEDAANDVDFNDYDWDGDGVVEQVYVLYAGLGQAAGGDDDTVWPHESQLRYYLGGALPIEGQNVKVNTYACGSELFYSVVYNKITGTTSYVSRLGGIGLICHEYTHCFNIPDMYDTNYTGFYGMGSYDLMASGSYNGNMFCPPAFTAYELNFIGWLEPIVLSEPTTVQNMAPLSEGGPTFIIYNDAHPDEYFLLENRQLTGWDASLPGKGLLITHVDYNDTVWEYNIVNSKATYSYGNTVYASNDHERCGIVSANASEEAPTEDGKLYPTTYNNSFTSTSNPADSLYNANTDGTYLLNKPITNIVQNADGTISFDFMGGSTDNVINGIVSVKTNTTASDGKTYNTLGVQMPDNNLPAGVYIRNGKKFVVK